VLSPRSGPDQRVVGRLNAGSVDFLNSDCWCLLEPSSAFTVIVWDNLVWISANFEECFVALRMISVCYPLENSLESHSEVSIYWFNYVIFVESVH
jgi:hypothetical protein